eukprot:CAMPEP_0170531190 /NCGR_PEP_ID=MMETSP0209-20121228/58967_1 /TAXON_ID=665100 ORGANISM="Litonotus pictus, Strain P1" /NCGR_SAMPLE_ID=MMETSP0209 /ASSEMBLY_ACC=CAM_ASM_000301 /LENGTH=63 /DNA_ID=CAMNT_0010825449 /DNA_START=57 /DNA_END=245 /DNA_ORIENTATION=+
MNRENINVYVGVQAANYTYFVDERIYTMSAQLEVSELNDKGQNFTVTSLDIKLCKHYYTQEEI